MTKPIRYWVRRTPEGRIGFYAGELHPTALRWHTPSRNVLLVPIHDYSELTHCPLLSIDYLLMICNRYTPQDPGYYNLERFSRYAIAKKADEYIRKFMLRFTINARAPVISAYRLKYDPDISIDPQETIRPVNRFTRLWYTLEMLKRGTTLDELRFLSGQSRIPNCPPIKGKRLTRQSMVVFLYGRVTRELGYGIETRTQEVKGETVRTYHLLYPEGYDAPKYIFK